jgi:hypothetical protein
MKDVRLVGEDEPLDLVEHDGITPITINTPSGRVTMIWPMRTEPVRQGVLVDEGQLYAVSHRGDH